MPQHITNSLNSIVDSLETYFRPGTTQNVAFTATAGTIATGVASTTRCVEIYTTTDAFIAIGAAPTATTSSKPHPLGQALVYKIAAGEKVSAVQITAAGTLYVTELS